MLNNKQDLAAQSEPATGTLIDTPKPTRKSKQSLLLQLIRREGGATLEELAAATGWLPHTVRAAITGLRKRGNDVRRHRVDGVSRYIAVSGGQ